MSSGVPVQAAAAPKATARRSARVGQEPAAAVTSQVCIGLQLLLEAHVIARTWPAACVMHGGGWLGVCCRSAGALGMLPPWRTNPPAAVLKPALHLAPLELGSQHALSWVQHHVNAKVGWFREHLH